MVTKEPKLAESDKIWADVKDLPLGIYALANQFVSQHVSKIDLPGKELYLKLKSSAVLPALEATVFSKYGNKYTVSLGQGYVSIAESEDPSAGVQEALKKQ